MKNVTITDVAEHAGVSKSTVSQYLNKRYEYMSDSTRRKIESSVRELDYTPNFIARSLTQKTTTTIGVIVANILHTFSTQVIRAIEDFCNEKNFHVIVCNADDDPIKEKKYIDMLRAKQVDGIITFPTSGNVDLYKNLLKSRYPVVFMDRKVSGISVDTVLLDNDSATEIAVKEFTENGFSRIGMISPPIHTKITPRIERVNGYKTALKNHDINFNSDYLVSTETNSIQTELNKMLDLSIPPNALLASNDFVMFEILKFAKNNQLKIPEDLGIIGIDDVSFASFYTPALTTIAQPAFEMGKKAAEVLLQKIGNDSYKTKVEDYRFNPKLIKRSSALRKNDKIKELPN